MDFKEYAYIVNQTALYPNQGDNLVYPVLGLNGEAGEVADKLKKIIRDEDGYFSPEALRELAKELGDVLWYVAACAIEIGFTFEDIAQLNADKLLSRLERGTIKGSGDNR